MYRTIIPRNVRLAEAPAHGMPVIAYEKYSKGSRAYQRLASEVMEQSRQIPLDLPQS